MMCIESNYAENVKSVEFIVLCNIWCPYHKWLYIYKGHQDPPFPKKSNNPGLNTMKFSYAIGCDYHLWIWTCLIN